jgi:lysophospholipase L1-like esterase
MHKGKVRKPHILRHIVSFAVVLAAAAGIVALNNLAEQHIDNASHTAVVIDPTPITFTPIETQAPKPTLAANIPEAEGDNQGEPTPSPTPYFFEDGDGDPIYDYSYGDPVPENELVSEDWWNDAVFIGNSRTDGFKKYSGIKGADVYAATSINVDNVRTKKVIPGGTAEDGSAQYITIVDAVKRGSYGKIYIMLGINDIGLAPDKYKEKIDALLSDILKHQPGAAVYLESIIPVATKAVDTAGPKFNNENIRAFNEKLKELAEEREYFYVDTYVGLGDSEGNMPPEKTFDNVHLNPDACKEWLRYLTAHTIRAIQ